MSDCIVIAVLNGIEISHKLFTPEMVADARAIRGCESVLGMPLCRLILVQLWTTIYLSCLYLSTGIIAQTHDYNTYCRQRALLFPHSLILLSLF